VSTSKLGDITATGAVRFQRELPGPIERVWSYLVDSEKRGKWLATGPMDARVGGRVDFKFVHRDLSPECGETPERFRKYESSPCEFTGKVTRCEPPRVLVITWGGTTDACSEVTFELTAVKGTGKCGTDEKSDKILLTLTHRRLPNRGEKLSVSGGWHTHLDVLADHLEGKTPKFFWTTFAEMEQIYDAQIKSL